jgi:hypothetical protein
LVADLRSNTNKKEVWKRLLAMDPATLGLLRDACGSASELSRAVGISDRRARELFTPPPKARQTKAQFDEEFDAKLHRTLVKGAGNPVNVETLANCHDASPQRVRDALVRLQGQGIAIVGDCTDLVSLPRAASTIRPYTPMGFTGKSLILGVVSDTHLGSKWATPDFLHSCYDHFAKDSPT